MRAGIAVICAAIFNLAVFPAFADTVVLRHLDGRAELSGEIISFDGETYRLETAYGTLTVNSEQVSCEGETCPEPSDYVPEIRISASPAARDLVMALLGAFATMSGLSLEQDYRYGTDIALTLSDRAEAVMKVNLRLVSAGESFADLLADEADLTIPMRKPTDEERAELIAAGLGDPEAPGRAVPLARDAVVPILYDPELNPNAVPGWNGDPSEIPEGLRIGMYSGRDGSPISVLTGSCKISLRPDLWTIGTDDYPFTVLIEAYHPRRKQSRATRNLLRFLASENAALAITDLGFVSVLPGRRPLNDQGARLGLALRSAEEIAAFSTLKKFAEELEGAERLSFTFRFQEGSSEMDERSKANLDRLTDYLRSEDTDSREIIFAGFSDGTGGFDANLALSRTRAKAVRDALAEKLGDDDLVSLGFGEALPMACDSDDWGRNVNRRVEVWLR